MGAVTRKDDRFIGQSEDFIVDRTHHFLPGATRKVSPADSSTKKRIAGKTSAIIGWGSNMKLTAKQFHEAAEKGRKDFQKILPDNINLESALKRVVQMAEEDLSESLITEATAIIVWSYKEGGLDCWKEMVGSMKDFSEKHGETIEKLYPKEGQSND